MQNNKGIDAISMLSDVLFQETDGPAPSFPENKRKALARLGYKTDEDTVPPEPSTTLAWE
jgi:hypothetical protein